MEYEWYADLFFLEEVYRDILIVWLAAVIGRKRVSVRRMLLAGIASGMCSTGAVLFKISCIWVPPAKGQSAAPTVLWEGGMVLIIGLLMEAVAFPARRSKNRDKTQISDSADKTGKQPADRILLAGKRCWEQVSGRGKMLGILIVSAGIIQSGLAFLSEWCFLTGWKSLLFMGFFCAGIRLLAAAVMESAPIGKKRYEVVIFLEGVEKHYTAMADSGNRLVEPVTGKPVSIIAAEDADGLWKAEKGILMIPYRAVGTEHGMLAGLIVDKMEIDSGEEKICISRPVVAVSKEQLFFEKNFNMILPESLVTGDKR